MKLLRRICVRLIKWAKFDTAEVLPLREQKAVSLERATEEYEGVVASSIDDGTFGSVLWGKNHMPDDCLRHHMESILKQCAATDHPVMTKSLFDPLVDCLFVDRIVKTGRGAPKKLVKAKPLRSKVDGQWPIDENVGAIHVSGEGKQYSTPLAIQKFIKELDEKMAARYNPLVKKVKKTTKKAAKKTAKKVVKKKKTPKRRVVAA